MQQSPTWKDKSRSVNQDYTSHMMKCHVHFRFHKCSLMDPILRQMNTFHIPTTYLI